jgi:hypothetical protein
VLELLAALAPTLLPAIEGGMNERVLLLGKRTLQSRCLLGVHKSIDSRKRRSLLDGR